MVKTITAYQTSKELSMMNDRKVPQRRVTKEI